MRLRARVHRVNPVRGPWAIVLMLGSLLAVGTVAQEAPANAPAATTPTAQPTAAQPLAAQPAAQPLAAQLIGATGGGAHVVAVGDVARVGGVDDQVAALTRALGPARLLLAGDVAYPSGSYSDFHYWFDPDWSGFRSILAAGPGQPRVQDEECRGVPGLLRRDRGALLVAQRGRLARHRRGLREAEEPEAARLAEADAGQARRHADTCDVA